MAPPAKQDTNYVKRHIKNAIKNDKNVKDSDIILIVEIYIELYKSADRYIIKRKASKVSTAKAKQKNTALTSVSSPTFITKANPSIYADKKQKADVSEILDILDDDERPEPRKLIYITESSKILTDI